MKVKSIIVCLSLFCSLSASAENKSVSLVYDHGTDWHSGHPHVVPTVSSDDDEVTIKSDSILYNVGIVIRDQYGNVMHQSTQTIGPNETTLYVPNQGEDSEKTTIDLYYDRKHLSGTFEE